MFRRRIPFAQIAFATVLGVAGGVYIYRPIFEPQHNNSVPETLSQTEDNWMPESQGQSKDGNNVPEGPVQDEINRTV
ncbi:protein PIGBOS1 [Oncorhynchus mykiss]|uniref:Uncharacterized protein n=1 Tax=Oncorhynchus mykiss TaxID=8022 RepID=A0A8K9XGB4_ONCMY|nr:protein PIGBOS1 [Oncorhynchus mykiss]